LKESPKNKDNGSSCEVDKSKRDEGEGKVMVDELKLKIKVYCLVNGTELAELDGDELSREFYSKVNRFETPEPDENKKDFWMPIRFIGDEDEWLVLQN